MMEDEKIYYLPGLLVTLKLDIPNKPVMLVVRKEASTIRPNGENILRGIRCLWFDTTGAEHEHIFNTKDLIKL